MREEIRALEAAAASTRDNRDASVVNSDSRPVAYTDIADSIWTISYRFADDPESENDSLEKAPLRRSFSGKLRLKFRKDGYTDLLSQESVGSTASSCQIVKAWGWDVELSKDAKNDFKDEEEYVLFSIDVELPPSEKDDQPPVKQRYYFQTKIQRDSQTGVLSFVDGTVTVKRDILQKSSQWAFLSPAGILAQFRYIGGFIAKPAIA